VIDVSAPSRFLSARVLLGSAVALCAGLGIAWLDTRPRWDDSGITAGLLAIAGAVASVVGAPWWLATVLAAGPLVAAEISRGPSMLLVMLFALAGASIGAVVRKGALSVARQ